MARRSDRQNHLDALDGVRVLMVLIIAAYHFWQQSWLPPSFTLFGKNISLDFLLRNGYLLVDGLLLLSGFLLYLPFARAKQQNAPLPDTRTFYKKRLARIVPSYYLCIFIIFFAEALPGHAYPTVQSALWDLLPHLTFTHTFFPASYQTTHLNGALWTLAVEMQAYLLFPLLARAFAKKPVLTFSGLCLCGWAFRAWVYFFVPSNLMYVNQLPAFLDVYALGMAGAALYTRLSPKITEKKLFRALSAVLFALSLYAIVLLLKYQGSRSGAGYEYLRQGQLLLRLPLCAVLLVTMLSAQWMARPVRFLLSNRVMRFLSLLCYNFYIWHQVLSVWLKKWHIPPYTSESPNVAGEQPWQTLYVLACFLGGLALSAAVTFLVERPAARFLLKKRKKTAS